MCYGKIWRHRPTGPDSYRVGVLRVTSGGERRLFHVSLLRLVFSLAFLTAALLFLAAPPTAGGELLSPLPFCPPGIHESVTVPTAVPSLDDPTACRARPTRIERATIDGLPAPIPVSAARDRGRYRHLGVTTAGEWSAVLGRLAVRDPGVRAGSYDFVATRFMAKRAASDGRTGWLEAGWAETGWSGRGAQRIYAFDSTGMSWLFFDDYRIGDGDRIWMYLHGEGEQWRAWLWWGDRWQLLASAALPAAGGALLEQYVEVHQADPDARAPIAVPPIRLDQVRVRATSGGPLTSWRAESVPTVAPLVSADYCLDWETRYDAWSTGDCPVTVQE